jgi:hypothetical protein
MKGFEDPVIAEAIVDTSFVEIGPRRGNCRALPPHRERLRRPLLDPFDQSKANTSG